VSVPIIARLDKRGKVRTDALASSSPLCKVLVLKLDKSCPKHRHLPSFKFAFCQRSEGDAIPPWESFCPLRDFIVATSTNLNLRSTTTIARQPRRQ
jgi:hypothetical protein